MSNSRKVLSIYAKVYLTFVFALPRGPWTWQCRSFDKDHFGRIAMVGGPIRGIKIPVRKLWLKM